MADEIADDFDPVNLIIRNFQIAQVRAHLSVKDHGKISVMRGRQAVRIRRRLKRVDLGSDPSLSFCCAHLSARAGPSSDDSEDQSGSGSNGEHFGLAHLRPLYEVGRMMLRHLPASGCDPVHTPQKLLTVD
jgi:hypothetical protein